MVDNVYQEKQTLVLDGDEDFEKMKDTWIVDIIQHLKQ